MTGSRNLCYDDFAANWFAPGGLVMAAAESAPKQIGQITQWRKEIGLLGRSP